VAGAGRGAGESGHGTWATSWSRSATSALRACTSRACISCTAWASDALRVACDSWACRAVSCASRLDVWLRLSWSWWCSCPLHSCSCSSTACAMLSLVVRLATRLGSLLVPWRVSMVSIKTVSCAEALPRLCCRRSFSRAASSCAWRARASDCRVSLSACSFSSVSSCTRLDRVSIREAASCACDSA
jgi:hypothetical protein